MIAFNIGGEASEYVRVSITRDNKDDWLSADVAIVVGGFNGSFSTDFNSWAFSDFAAQLAELHRTVSGSAIFTSYEKQLELTLTCDALGHIMVRGEAMDIAGTGSTLIFKLAIDQTHVPKILSSVQATVEKYPRRHV